MRWNLQAAFAVLFCALATAAAATPVADALPTEQQYAMDASVRKALRFGMTATGTLVVEPDGRVTEVELDMPPSTREPYREAMSRWTFKPVVIDGKVVRAKAHFQLEAIGERAPGSDQVKLGIENIWFVDPPPEDARAAARQAFRDMRPPRYPTTAAREGFGAEVNLLLRIDGEGRVVDVGVHSLSLGVETIQQHGRALAFAKQFASASMNVARSWTVRDPEVIERGLAIVPVSFTPPGRNFGGWQPRIPVDLTLLPWMAIASENAVAITAGGSPESSRFELQDDVAGTFVN